MQAIYQEYARQLIETGHAYTCFCTPDRLEKVRQQKMATRAIAMARRRLTPEEARDVTNGGVVRFKTPHERHDGGR
jgi:glutamyl/glutaminyl-tRNA synthetase